MKRMLTALSLAGFAFLMAGCDDAYMWVDDSPCSRAEYKQGAAAISRLYRRAAITHSEASAAMVQLEERALLWHDLYGKPLDR